jgi:hypothetical protein
MRNIGEDNRQLWKDAHLGECMLIFIFLIGIGVMLAAPLLRRPSKDSVALAVGASIVIAFSLVGLANPDLRAGQAAVNTNRGEYLFFLACELPVFLLALISWKRFKWAFWLGWGINVALSLIVLWVAIELEFFWHW